MTLSDFTSEDDYVDWLYDQETAYYCAITAEACKAVGAYLNCPDWLYYGNHRNIIKLIEPPQARQGFLELYKVWATASENDFKWVDGWTWEERWKQTKRAQLVAQRLRKLRLPASPA